MRLTNSIFTIILALSSLNLFAQDKNDAYFDGMAKEICGCSSVMLGYMEDINRLSEEGKTEELYKLSEKIEPEAVRMNACIDGLNEKYKDVDGNAAYEKRAEEALIRVCPAYAKAVNIVGAEAEEVPEVVNPEPEIQPEVATPGRDDEYFKNLALDMCGCMEGLFEKVAKMELLQAEGKLDEVLKLAEELESDSKEMETCIYGLESKYGDIDGNSDYEKRAEAALRKYCPAFAASLGDGTLSEEDVIMEEIPEEEILIEDISEEEIVEIEEDVLMEDVEIVEIEDVGDVDFYKQTTVDICDCIDSQKGLEDEYKKVAATKNPEKLMAFRMGLQESYPGMFECLATMNDRVGQLNKDEASRKASKEAMIENCPLFLDLMGLR